MSSHALHAVKVSVQFVGAAAVTHVLVGGAGVVLHPGFPLHSGHWQSHESVLSASWQSTHWLYFMVHDVGVATCRQDGVGGLMVMQPGLPLTAGHVPGAFVVVDAVLSVEVTEVIVVSVVTDDCWDDIEVSVVLSAPRTNAAPRATRSTIGFMIDFGCSFPRTYYS